MGNAVSGTATAPMTAPLEQYATELMPDLRNVETLGNTRLFKTLRADYGDSGGRLLIKLFIKPDLSLSLERQRHDLEALRQRLQGCSNVKPPQRVEETDRVGIIVRQELYASLYDRISTRPFLSPIEKKWITYQLLNGLVECHSKNVCHGDIKAQNVLVTTWNWAYITDFASPYKPVMLIEDYPADYSYFYDTTGRRTCYIAPERFYRASAAQQDAIKNARLTPAMDIFSLGCVIAEFFLEGQQLFNLSQLLSFRTGEYNPQATLKGIEDEHVRELIAEMIALDPSARLSAQEYLDKYRNTVFPSYFSQFLHSYTLSLTEPTSPWSDPDARIERMHQYFPVIALSIRMLQMDKPSPPPVQRNANSDHGTRSDVKPADLTGAILTNQQPPDKMKLDIAVNIPEYTFSQPSRGPQAIMRGDEGALMFVSLICSTLRSLTRPSSKLRAFDMLLSFGAYLSDDHKLERIIPFLCTTLLDRVAIVRTMGLLTVTQLLSLVRQTSQADTDFFSAYLLPYLTKLSEDREVLVRTMYASCIASLCQSALRFLEDSFAHRKDDLDPDERETPLTAEPFPLDTPAIGLGAAPPLTTNIPENFDVSLVQLREMMMHEVITLITDRDIHVNRAVLANMASLSSFFGQQRSDELLQHLTTFLNSADWQLRAAYLESTVGVGLYVGGQSLASFVLPLMVEALADENEFVVSKVLASLTALASQGLFPKGTLRSLSSKIVPLLCHPGSGIRFGAITFISTVAALFSPADAFCFLQPLVRPFLTQPLVVINELSLLKALQPPLSRPLLEQASKYALKIALQRQKQLGQDGPKEDAFTVGSPATATLATVISGMSAADASNSEDEFRQSVLRLGLNPQDETKLLAMQDLIFRKRGGRPRSVGATAATLNMAASGISAGVLSREPSNANVATFYTMASTASSGDVRSNDEGYMSLKYLNLPTRRLVSNASPVRRTSHSLTPAFPSGSEAFSNSSFSAAASTGGASAAHLHHSRRQYQSATVGSGGSSSVATESLNAIASRHNMPMTTPALPASMPSGTSSSVAMETVPTLPLSATDPPCPFEDIWPISTGRRAFMHKRSNSKSSGSFAGGPAAPITSWRPEGILVANLHEHYDPILCIKTSPDGLFFLTASADSSVRLWDLQKLDKNHTSKSRSFVPISDGRIVSVIFVENSPHVLISTTEGSIHLLSYSPSDTARSSDGTVPPASSMTPSGSPSSILRIVRKFKLASGYAVWMDHYTQGERSILAYATSMGKIMGMDLITGDIVWSLDHPARFGIISAVVMDRRRLWLVTGTHRGALTCFDLRFQLSIKTWTVPTNAKVTQLSIHPRHPTWIVVATTKSAELIVWNLEHIQFQQVFGVSDRNVRTWWPETTQTNDPLMQVNDLLVPMSAVPAIESSVRAIVAPPDANYVITAGTDRRIVYWDLIDPSRTYVIAGQDLSQPKPVFRREEHHGIAFWTEGREKENSASSARSTSRQDERNAAAAAASGVSTVGLSTMSAFVASRRTKVPMPGHKDCITVLAVTEAPYMLISGSRDGSIKVWK